MIIPANVSIGFKCQFDIRVDGNTEVALLSAQACVLAKMRGALEHKLDNINLELEAVNQRLQELNNQR